MNEHDFANTTMVTTSQSISPRPDVECEWLETDGRGGFAMGTVSGVRTRRYHSILMLARNPPTDRVVLVNGLEVWVETPRGTFPISTQRYQHDHLWPDGYTRLHQFSSEPWPTWEYDLGNGIVIVQQLFIARGIAGTAIRWSLSAPAAGVKLHVKPLLSGRDYHGLHRENSDMDLTTEHQKDACVWKPYSDCPEIFAQSNGDFTQQPEWFRAFHYELESQRGLDAVEDLACPGEFHFDLSRDDAVLLLGAGQRFSQQAACADDAPDQVYQQVALQEKNRRDALTPLERSANQYIVQRGSGQTIVAGYPWFADWGRDTFIAIRGLCLALDKHELARDILVSWATTISAGMIPNRFPDQGDQPEYNSVDASLWYIVAIHEYRELIDRLGLKDDPAERKLLDDAIESILTGYSTGTRHRIGMDSDGLIACGEPGVQLTWMDAKVGDWVVTPRIGKPVEIQCLWINALWIGSNVSPKWRPLQQQAEQTFKEKFWNAERNCLFDVVDANHEPGTHESSIRPNQLLAVGGLPYQVIDGDKAQAIVSTAERELMTTQGPRSLSPNDAEFQQRYTGSPLERDGAYHQGTVWPWLMGPFVEAWLNVHGKSASTIAQATERFLKPMEQHLKSFGLGHISEIADATEPYQSRGCPFQAWSLAEYIRLKRLVMKVH